MAIDLERERGLTPAEAAALIPSYRRGKPTHISRVIRMITQGVRLPDGSRLRLEAVRYGQQWITSARCVREFGERLAAAQIRSDEDSAPPIRSATARGREASRASATLNKIGI